MIYTVTFNPAIDYVIKVDNLTLTGNIINSSKKEMTDFDLLSFLSLFFFQHTLAS